MNGLGDNRQVGIANMSRNEVELVLRNLEQENMTLRRELFIARSQADDAIKGVDQRNVKIQILETQNCHLRKELLNARQLNEDNDSRIKELELQNSTWKIENLEVSKKIIQLNEMIKHGQCEVLNMLTTRKSFSYDSPEQTHQNPAPVAPPAKSASEGGNTGTGIANSQPQTKARRPTTAVMGRRLQSNRAGRIAAAAGPPPPTQYTFELVQPYDPTEEGEGGNQPQQYGEMYLAADFPSPSSFSTASSGNGSDERSATPIMMRVINSGHGGPQPATFSNHRSLLNPSHYQDSNIIHGSASSAASGSADRQSTVGSSDVIIDANNSNRRGVKRVYIKTELADEEN